MQRDYSISILRVLAMVLIVFYHCFCYCSGSWGYPDATIQFYAPFIHEVASLGLDTFVCISGFLYFRILRTTNKYDNNGRFIGMKVKRLLIPYVFWCLVLCLSMPQYYDLSQIFWGISHLWFLLMLFGVFCFFTLTKRFWNQDKPKRCAGCLFVMLACYLLVIHYMDRIPYIVSPNSVGILDFNFILQYIPIFYLGILAAKFNLSNFFRLRGIKLALASIVMVGLGLFFNLPIHLKLSALYSWIPYIVLILLGYAYLSNSKRVKNNLGGVGIINY